MTDTEDILSDTKSDNSNSSDNQIEITVFSNYNIFNNETNKSLCFSKKTLVFDLENQIANTLIDYPYKRQYLSYETFKNKNRILSSSRLINNSKIYLEPVKIIVGFTYGNIKGFAGEFFHFQYVLDIKKEICNLFNKYKNIILDIDKIKLFFDEIDIHIDYDLDDKKKLFEYDYINLNNDEYWKKIIMIYND